MSWSVRRLTADDAAAYREIRLDGQRSEPAAFGSDFEREHPRPVAEWAAQLDRNFTFGAVGERGLAGVATFIPEGMDKTRHRAHLVAVYVRPEERGKGAALALLDALIEAARREVIQLHLTVTTENEAARRLYERLGFTIYGTDPRGLNVDGRFYDEHLMVLRLDEGSRKVMIHD